MLLLVGGGDRAHTGAHTADGLLGEACSSALARIEELASEIDRRCAALEGVDMVVAYETMMIEQPLTGGCVPVASFLLLLLLCNQQRLYR